MNPCCPVRPWCTGAKWCDGGHLWGTRNVDQRLVYEVEDSWWRELFEKVLEGKARQPSTGFVALAVAVAVAQAAGAPAPSVYGFGTCTPCTKYYKCQPDDIWEEAQAQGTDDFEHP